MTEQGTSPSSPSLAFETDQEYSVKGKSAASCRFMPPVACTINVYDRKFYVRKLRLSLERNYDRNPS